MAKGIKWTDEALLAEGRKYASRAEFSRNSGGAYNSARRRNLLDLLYPPLRTDWSNDEAVLAEGRKYSSRREFQSKSGSAYRAARRRNLLNRLYPSTRDTTVWENDEAVLAEGRKYVSRLDFRYGSYGAYRAAASRGLLDTLHPRHPAKWTDAEVLAEGRKHTSRAEFSRNSNRLYQVALRRNLLDLIDWPEENAQSDNDAIYIWRAVGQHYNGNPVYKIGVTSARLGIDRIVTVARRSGFEFDLICCEPVACKATDLERKLHLLGEDPQFTGFDGCTEFRALSDGALYAAVTMISNVTA